MVRMSYLVSDSSKLKKWSEENFAPLAMNRLEGVRLGTDLASSLSPSLRVCKASRFLCCCATSPLVVVLSSSRFLLACLWFGLQDGCI